MRGDKQHRHSLIPSWGEKFTVELSTFTPEPVAGSDLRVQREYAAQIINRLAQMEETYFALRRQRRRGFKRPGEREKKSGFAISQENPHRS
jgi:hypothetical protein